MSGRRTQNMPPAQFDKIPKERSRCTAAICVSWKVFTCIFSHVMLVTLVVAYCIFGAITFEYLEAKNEIEVKKGIRSIRGNLTEAIWKLTYEEVQVLHEQNWTKSVVDKLQGFENEIINSMKLRGWDGNEDINKIQWTFSGALFYSIIVITTIGYGHIAPKTYLGKISTIFYAILGIPLMLLCLSNIGDIMASSFRFLYWRVCCYVCTREPKKKRLRRMETFRQPNRYSGRSNVRPGSFRRSMRISQRTNDSGVDNSFYEPNMMHAYSDTDLRYSGTNFEHQDWSYDRNFNNRSAQNRNQRSNNNRVRNRDQYRDRHTVERERYGNRPPDQDRYQSANMSPVARSRQTHPKYGRSQSAARDIPSKSTNDMSKYSDMTLPASFGRQKSRSQIHATRAQSLDPRSRRDIPIDFDFNDPPCRTPVLCNKYAIDDMDTKQQQQQQQQQGITKRQGGQNTSSLPRQSKNNSNKYIDGRGGDGNDGGGGNGGRFEPSHISSPSIQQQQRHHHHYIPDEDFEMQPIRKNKRRERHAPPPPSPRIMSPMGFAVHRQARLQAHPDDDSMYGDDGDFASDLPARVKPVPIWLCVFLVVSYIIAGAFLFSNWEGWSFLDSAYFCFITLTTIGFGDFVPAQGVKDNPEVSIAFCSLYLLFGIALLAMSFNLVQEEVIANVKSVARRLGILKEEEMDY